MSRVRSAWTATVFGALSAVMAVGCGSESTEETQPADNQQAQSAETGLPTASISSTDSPVDDSSEPAEGSPEWLLTQIRDIRLQAVAAIPKNGEARIDLDKMRAARRDRNQKIVGLATEVIKKTHDGAEQKELFTKGVHELLQARLQLANMGEAAAVDALYTDVASLKARDPQSRAAVEAAHTLVMFANNNARRFGNQEPRWLQEFTRQARLFASDFPTDPRAPQALFSAGLSCDLQGMLAEATACFVDLQKQFPKNPLTAQLPPILRRLQLVGQPVEFAGPTIEGDFINIESYRGRLALIVFWSSSSPDFQAILPKLNAATQKYNRYMRVIGVCLDENEAVLESFLDKSSLAWTQVFDPNNRRWDNDIVKHYGVRKIPTVWLIDPQGIVVSTHITAENLDATIEKAIENARRAARSR